METDFKHIMERKKQLSIYDIQYSTNRPNEKLFYKGYSIEGEKVIGRKTILTLTNLIKDSGNYITDRSQNCVMVAHYGIKLEADTLKYRVFIGKQPCLKMLVINEPLNTETVFDLSDKNTIIPFLDSLFARK
jgi:hypothetical protein